MINLLINYSQHKIVCRHSKKKKTYTMLQCFFLLIQQVPKCCANETDDLSRVVHFPTPSHQWVCANTSSLLMHPSHTQFTGGPTWQTIPHQGLGAWPRGRTGPWFRRLDHQVNQICLVRTQIWLQMPWLDHSQSSHHGNSCCEHNLEQNCRAR
jgi:hypothetical protein